MKLSEETLKQIQDNIQSTYDEATYGNHYELDSGGDPFRLVTLYVAGLLIDYYSEGYKDAMGEAKKIIQEVK